MLIESHLELAVKGQSHWKTGSAHLQPIIHNGKEMPIDHLAPFTFPCPCPDIGRDLMIRSICANHCYTEKYDATCHATADIILTEGAGRHRVFCPIRYGLSFQLPALITNLPQHKVHQTGQTRNYVYVVPLQVGGQHYEVYFMLQRASAADGADLRLTVESAYPNGGSNLRKRPRAIRFAILAHKVLTNQRVHFAPR
jgi:hypothetical protein